MKFAPAERFAPMSKQLKMSTVAKKIEKLPIADTSQTAEKLRKGFANAVKSVVKEHRAAGRPVHDAKPRKKPRK